MKKLFFSLVALICATMSYAQSSLIATLSHDGEISTFYGTSALRDAHEAAQHGDIITLSSGSFTSVTITKAITLRGAGMQVDTIAKTNPTIITGDFDINIPDSVEQRLTMEGVFHNNNLLVRGTLKNASFLKNKFLFFYVDGIVTNSTFIHCKISNYSNDNNTNSANFVNSYIRTNSDRYIYNAFFTNCFVVCQRPNQILQSTFNNCILYSTYSYRTSYADYRFLNSNCAAYYCVTVSHDGTLFHLINNQTNINYGLDYALDNLFITYKGSYTDEETFELTDEAKAKYLGSDGTEVGIHGGALPFDPTPTNPQITKCNVASKSTADGKLSVDIEVSATE